MTDRTIAGAIRRDSAGGADNSGQKTERIGTALIRQSAVLHLTGENFGMAGDSFGGPPQRLPREGELEVFG